jgi:hypothetical protein
VICFRPPASLIFIFQLTIQLAIIFDENFTQLYCAAASEEKWSNVQGKVGRFDVHYSRLSKILSKNNSMLRSILAMKQAITMSTEFPARGLLYSTVTPVSLSSRPALRPISAWHQSKEYRDFGEGAVKACIHSAHRVIGLLTWPVKTVQGLKPIHLGGITSQRN